MSAADVVTVEHLVKWYGRLIAVNDVSFSIHEGEIFGVIGPNGAGKTTTVECIAGLRAPDSGSIDVSGLSPQSDRSRIREFVGVQLQESALPPRLKVGEAGQTIRLVLFKPSGSGRVARVTGHQESRALCVQEPFWWSETEAITAAYASLLVAAWANDLISRL